MNSRRLLSHRFLAVPIGIWLIILVSRCALLGVMKVGRSILPPPPYEESWMLEKDHPFRDYLANFDGAWFIRVAALGYKRLESGDYDLEAEKKRLRVMDEWGYEDGRKGLGYRHFPFLPYLIRAAQKIINDWTLAGLAISNFFSFVFLLYLFRLTELELNERAAWWSIVFATLAPGAHYLMVIYSEGLYMAGMVASVYCARRGHWMRSFLWGVFASTSRFEGAFTIIILFLILVEQSGGYKYAFKDRRLLYIVGVPLGLLFPFIEYWRASGSPFAQLLTTKKVLGVGPVWPWQAFAIDFHSKNPLTFMVDYPVLIVSVILTIFAARKLSRPLAVWTVIGLFLRLCHPHLALVRFFLVFFTFYIFLGDFTVRRPRFGIILLILSALLLIIFSILFINGYWIA